MEEEIWVTAMQPTLFPSIHLMQRIGMCRKCVVMVEAQYDKTHMRAYLVNKQGEFRVVAPCSKPRRAPFYEIELRGGDEWSQKLLKSLKFTYGRSKHYDEIMAMLAPMIIEAGKSADSASLGMYTMEWLSNYLGFQTQVIQSLALVAKRPEDPTEWISDLCVAAKATDYVQGQASMDAYMRRSMFDPSVRLWCQNYKVPHYDQNDLCFEQNVSILDPLFMLGREATCAMVNVGKQVVVWA